METVVAQQVFGRPYIAPPGTPTAQVQTLRAAFLAALADKKLLADAKRSRIEIKATSGLKVQQMVEKMYAAPPSVIATLKKILPVAKKKSKKSK